MKKDYWRDYSNVDLSVPYFYSPQPWFRWPQRYIYKITGDGYSYQEGYGGIHSDWTYRDKRYHQTYKKSDAGEMILYVRTEEYTADFKETNVGWSWWLGRMVSAGLDVVFEDELLFFDYPLVLGKRWGGNAKILLNEEKLSPFGKVDYEAKIVEYVPEYRVPEQLGLFTDLNRSKEKFINAKDLYPPGCLVSKLNLKMKTENGDIDQTMEVWKDIRGCVPVQRTYAGEDLLTEEIAYRWTGNTLL